jgi:hypothetical protein
MNAPRIVESRRKPEITASNTGFAYFLRVTVLVAPKAWNTKDSVPLEYANVFVGEFEAYMLLEVTSVLLAETISRLPVTVFSVHDPDQ